MYILNAQTVTRSKNSAGVMFVKDIFENNRQVTGTKVHDFVKSLQTVAGQTLFQEVKKGLRHRSVITLLSEFRPADPTHQDDERTGPATGKES